MKMNESGTMIWSRHKYLPVIRWGLSEPVDHFAFYRKGMILHSTSLHGVHEITIEEFEKARRVHLSVSHPVTDQEYESLKGKIIGRNYDYKLLCSLIYHAFIFKIFKKPIDYKKLGDHRGWDLCQEIYESLPRARVGFEAWTPYQLYKELVNGDIS